MRSLPCLIVPALVLIGCTADPARPGSSSSSSPSPVAPGPRPPGATPTPPPVAPGACATTGAFASPLRRLTRAEYNNTVRDLLGDRTAPGDRFPPDEVSGGFSNNAAVLGVTPLLAEKYQEAAEALAAQAVTDLPALLGCDPAGAGEAACARQFVERFGRRAYRRPLAPAERDRLLALYELGRAGGSFAEGIEVVLRAVLQAPAFLYRIEGRPGAPRATAGGPLAPLDGFEMATRLSYFLWGTMPDEALFAAAERNALRSEEEVAAMARRMLADPRARPMVAEFHRQWLGLGALDRLAKDAGVYPEFNDELRAAMRAETAAFVEARYFGAERTLASLLTAAEGFVTPALARLYGVPVPGGSGPQRVSLPAAERAGLITQAGFLAVHALPDQSSPVHRGKLVREQILCQPMPPQPPGLMVTPPEVDPRRPTRERFAQHAADPQCAGCHNLMDPIGFGFERYDGLGRFRASEAGAPVDDRGEVTAIDGGSFGFRGARELGERLAASPEVGRCLGTQWYRFALGRLEGPGDRCSLAALEAAFRASPDLGELLVALTRTEAFRHRPVVGGAP